MSEKFITAGVTILVAIVGVAVIAVLVSPKAKTSGVIGAFSGGFASALCKALSPVTGSSCGGLIENVTSGVTFPTNGGTTLPLPNGL